MNFFEKQSVFNKYCRKHRSRTTYIACRLLFCVRASNCPWEFFSKSFAFCRKPKNFWLKILGNKTLFMKISFWQCSKYETKNATRNTFQKMFLTLHFFLLLQQIVISETIKEEFVHWSTKPPHVFLHAAVKTFPIHHFFMFYSWRTGRNMKHWRQQFRSFLTRNAQNSNPIDSHSKGTIIFSKFCHFLEHNKSS